MISITQAAGNTFAEWLAGKMPDTKVIASWPAPDRELPVRAISFVTSGARRDRPMQTRAIKQTLNGSNKVDVVWQVAACTQPVQLDVWARSNFDRDDMLAQLDTLLNYGEGSLTGNTNADPVGHSVLLYVQDGWEEFQTVADFAFSNPDTEDSSDTAARDVYRATYRGDVDFMLAIKKTSPRILQSNFSMFLNGSNAAGL